MKNRALLSLTITGAIYAGNVLANPLPVPRAHDILPQAARCGIGHIGQTGKAGDYNPYCTQLTDAEKCLALVKANMSTETGELSTAYEQEKAQYCVEEFRRALLER